MEVKVRRLESSDKHCFIRSPEPIIPFHMDNLRIVRWITKKTRPDRPDRHDPFGQNQNFLHYHNHNHHLHVFHQHEGRAHEIPEIRGCFYIFNRWTLKLETVFTF